MRVAFVTHQFFPRFYTGVERLTLNLARQLALMGHECVVLTSADHSSGSERPYEVEGARVRPLATPRADLARPWLHDDRLGPALGRALDEEEVDLVHVMHPMRLPQAFAEAARRRLPVVAHAADFVYVCARITMIRRDGTLCPSAEGGHACVDVCRIATAGRRLRWGRDALAGAAAVVAPSRFMIDLHVQEGFDTAAWHHIPWGTDYALHRGRLPAPRSDGGLSVGFIGTLLAHKGAHLLVEALRLLPDADVRLELWGGSFHESEYEKELRALAAGDSRIAFRGSYAHEQLPEILSGLDAVAIPSLWHENLPTSGLNAIASGVPLLVSDVAGLRELVEDFEAGATFRSGDAADLAATLRGMLEEPALLRGIREHMRLPPSVEEEAWRVEELYRQAVG